MHNKNHPQVGIGVIILNHAQILMGERIGSHGHNTWCFPGGHLEYQETPQQCAVREVKEETGIEISHVTEGPWSNDFFIAENKHYITLFMLARFQSGVVRILEPTKCKQWQWFLWEELPSSLFLPVNNLLGSGKYVKHVTEYLKLERVIPNLSDAA